MHRIRLPRPLLLVAHESLSPCSAPLLRAPNRAGSSGLTQLARGFAGTGGSGRRSTTSGSRTSPTSATSSPRSSPPPSPLVLPAPLPPIIHITFVDLNSRVPEFELCRDLSRVLHFCAGSGGRLRKFAARGGALKGGRHRRRHLHRPLAGRRPEDARQTGGAGHQWSVHQFGRECTFCMFVTTNVWPFE